MFLIIAPFVVWFALIIASCYEQDIKLFSLIDKITTALNKPTQITLNEYSLKAVLIFLFIYVMGVGVYFSSRENRRPGEEHGSAKWGVVSAIAKKYVDKKEKSKNIILSQNMRIGLNAKNTGEI